MSLLSTKKKTTKTNPETQNLSTVFSSPESVCVCVWEVFLSLDIHSLQVPDKIACALHTTGQILSPLTATISFFIDLNRTKIQGSQNGTGMSSLDKQHSCQQTSLTIFYISLLSLILKSVKFLPRFF